MKFHTIALRNVSLGLVLTLSLAACGGGRKADDGPKIEDMPPQVIYAQAEEILADRKENAAAELFGEVERLYPYSEWAKRALIMQAYSYHLDKNYDASRATAQRFIEFFPADEDAAYAQYLLALGYYDQIDDVGRDQGLTFQALQALRTVIEVYPESEYARSARLKFDLAFDHLAAKEMEVGRYYLARDHYLAAVNRFRAVVEDFQTTTHTPEALYRLVEAYLSLGLDEEAQTAGAILGHNYRASEWYADSYALLTGVGLDTKARGDNWLAKIYRQMVRGEWL